MVVLTFNCDEFIANTIRAAKKLTKNIVCVDSGSSDDTRKVLERLKCDVYERPFIDYAEQRNWIIDRINPHYPWQLHIDADEVLDDDAIKSIREVLKQYEQSETEKAFLIRRKTYFMGKPLHYGGTVSWHLRLFRSGVVKCENRKYDQHFVANVKARKIKRGQLHDMNTSSLAEWTARHNRWSDLEAQEILNTTELSGGQQIRASLVGDPRERVRFYKGLYYHCPLLFRALFYFFYRYFLRGGFLDGKIGFIYNFLQAFWFRVLVDAKMIEMRSAENPPKIDPNK